MVDLSAAVSGKRVWVTGATSGLGAHFCRVLAGAGAKVAASGRRAERLESLRLEIAAAGHHLDTFPLDVTDTDRITATAHDIESRFGGLDGLVNNAGIAAGGPALDVTPDEFDRIMATNLKGAFFVAKAAARMMAKAHGGSIVNIASILGERVQPGVLPYATSKAGVIQMTKALALEWARHHIRVNAIEPGYIKTDINRDFLESERGQATVKNIPMRRIGEKNDLDAVLLLLIGDAAPYLTGTAIPVDGGHLVSSL